MSDAREEGITFTASTGETMTMLGGNYMQVIVLGDDPADYSRTFIGPGNIVMTGKWQGRKVTVTDPPFAELMEHANE